VERRRKSVSTEMPTQPSATNLSLYVPESSQSSVQVAPA
jgi:hypothetical protein